MTARPLLLTLASTLAGTALAAPLLVATTAGPAAALDPTADCTGLSVWRVATGGDALVARVPVTLSALDLPATAFTARQGGRDVPVAVEHVTGDVAVVLALDTTTGPSAVARAQLAAHELVSGLPSTTPVVLVSGSGDPVALTPLTTDRERAGAALAALAPTGPRSTAAALRTAAGLVPAGSSVVLLTDSTDDGSAADAAAAATALSTRGLALSRVHYAGPAQPAAGTPLQGDACTASTAGQPLLARVDAAAATVSGRYRLTVPGAGERSTTVTVTAAGVTAQSGVAGPVAPAASAAPSERERALLPLGVLAALVAALGLLAAAWRRTRTVRARRAVPSTSSAAGGYAATAGAPTGVPGVSVHRGGGVYPDVDVAIVQESTYPYLKGGVSAVVHDIVTGNQDLTFGIIHISWDRDSPSEDLYGMPENVKWVRPVFLSMREHADDFTALRGVDLGMTSREREVLSTRLYDALEAVLAGDMDPMWALYDEGMNPRTRSYPIWALLGTKEFMQATRERLDGLGLPLTDTFWVLREFFSLACAVLGEDLPRARVYHAHTTGYASLLSAAAARQNDTSFLLTEHNLYVRDTVNFLLERSMAKTLRVNDWREFDVTPVQRAWMAWWIEMGRFCYPSAEAITYLYPKAITEAADLGAPVEKSVVIPNGMIVREFEEVAEQRRRALPAILADDPDRVWRLVYIARVVPIKGLADLIDTARLLLDRGITNFHIDILGPTDHHPAYYALCREKARALNVEDHLTFRGTVKVRDLLGEFDVLVLPSYNEGQPIVVLEAMTAGIPTVGTEVGGMAQLIGDDLTTSGGRTWGPCGLLVQPEYAEAMADALQTLMRSPAMYAELAANARGRVSSFFQLEDAMGAYNRLYRELGGLEQVELETHGQVIDLTRTERADDRA